MELPSEYAETKIQMGEKVEQHFHVLAVDDSVIDRKVLETLLQKVSSYRVTCVDSGDKALKYLGLVDDIDNASSSSSPESSKHEKIFSLDEIIETSMVPCKKKGSIKVNLIMTDYCMPGMSGYDLLKRLKGSSWKDVPVVVMSSENVPSRISMCLEGGAEEFLLKPIQLSDLEKLQPYLSKSNDHSEQEGSHSSTATTVNHEDSKNDNEDNSSNDNNTGCSKRKAVSPEPESERRPKTK